LERGKRARSRPDWRRRRAVKMEAEEVIMVVSTELMPNGESSIRGCNLQLRSDDSLCRATKLLLSQPMTGGTKLRRYI
jgi:hypothetical protein